MSEHKIYRYVKYFIGITIVFFIFLWPLLSLFGEAFIVKNEGFTLRYFMEVLSDPGFVKVITNTLFINCCSMKEIYHCIRSMYALT